MNGHHTNGTGESPKITLYTNHRCPYAHRAHITLKELDLPYEEVIIDLDTPRPDWYLKVNPRGLVPSIDYSKGNLHNEILTESAVVSQFLAESYPSHLLPSSTEAPLLRARMNFFLDAWNTKCQPNMFPILMLKTQEEREKKSEELIQNIQKEIEPLLANANPFFGGSSRLTFAETQIAPFLIRMTALSKDGRYMPSSLNNAFDKLPNFSKWKDAIIKDPSVLSVWDEEGIVAQTSARLEKMRAQPAK